MQLAAGILQHSSADHFLASSPRMPAAQFAKPRIFRFDRILS
jgi:hypothetical protein